MPVAAIVLAAGASRRLGQPKQLLPLDGETLLGRALRLSIEAGASPVIAVLGAYHKTIRASAPFHNAVCSINRDWRQGLSTSIQAGLRALEAEDPQAAGTLLLGCDQPRLTAAHLRALIQAFAAQPEPVIAASAYGGIVGIPALFPRSLFAQLQALRGDQGARALLANPQCRLISIAFAGGEIDIDQPHDLAELE